MNAVDAVAAELAEHLRQAHLSENGYARSDLAGLPEPVARVAAVRLDDIADRESVWPETAWIDSDHEAILRARLVAKSAARAAARVPANEWASFLATTCRLVVSQITAPAKTLAAFAFEGVEGSVAAEFAVERSRVFVPYSYLPEIASRYAERKEVARFDEDAFAVLLRRIDQRMVGGLGAEEWLALLAPAFDLLGSVGGRNDALPVGLLCEIFEARNLPHLAEALVGEDDLTREQLLDCLSTVLPGLEGLDDFAEDGSASVEDGEGKIADVPTARGVDADAEESFAGEGGLEIAGVEAARPESDDTVHSADSISNEFRPIEGAFPEHADELEIADASNTPQAEVELLAPVGIDDPLRHSTAPHDAAVPAIDVDSSDLPDADILAETEPVVRALAEEHEPPIADRNPEAAPDDDLPGSSSADTEEAALDAWIFPAGTPMRAAEAQRGVPSTPTTPPVIGSHFVPPAEAIVDDSEVLGPPRPAQVEAESEEDEPLWKRLSRQAETDRPTADGAVSTDDTDALETEASDEPEPLWKRFASGLSARDGGDSADMPVDEPLEILEARVLGLGMRSSRESFVGTLFGGSTEQYRAVLAKLDSCDNRPQAVALVRDAVLQPGNIHVLNDTAVAFTDAVEARFGRRSRS